MGYVQGVSDQYHHGDLRKALLEASVELIAEKGVAGLSLREAARRVGVSHAAPYRHFPDKNSVLVAIALQGYDWLAEAGEEAMAGYTDAQQRLDSYGVAYVLFARRHPVHFRVMFTESMELPEGVLPDNQHRSFGLLVDAASAAVGVGHDPLLTAVSAWSWPHGLAMLILDGRVPSEQVATDEQVEKLAWRVAAQLGGTLPEDVL